MTISEQGLALIEKFESLSLNAYQDIRGVWTIGYGHTGREVVKGLTITLDHATALLDADSHAAAAAVSRLVKVPLTQNQFDALVSLTYNIGIGALTTSHLLRHLNAKDYITAGGCFVDFMFASGKKSEGLLNRRKLEAALYFANT